MKAAGRHTGDGLRPDFLRYAIGRPAADDQRPGYRSNGEYFDVATTAPLATNSNGDITGGQLRSRGPTTQAVLTLVPGSVLRGTMTVNGTPVTSVPTCR